MDADDGLNSPLAKKMKSREPDILHIERSLKVTNLPVPFPELTFMSQLEKFRLRNNICPDAKKTITNWMYFVKEGYVFVEFCTVEIATQLLKLKEADIHNHGLVQFECLMYTEDTILPLDVTLDASRFPTNLQASTPTKNVVDLMQKMSPFKPKQMFPSDSNNNDDNLLSGIGVLSDEIGETNFAENIQIEILAVEPIKDQHVVTKWSEERAKEQAQLTENVEDQEYTERNFDNIRTARPKVTFGELSEFYNDIDFINFLKAGISKKCTALPPLCDKSFNIMGYNKENHCVTVEFMSADVADAVAKKLQGASFLLQPWTVHLHAQPQRLLFGAVSEFYEEDNFINFLNICIEKKCQVSNIDSLEKRIISYNEIDHEVIVEFDSAELAKEVCTKLQGIEYMLQVWKISEFREGPVKLKFIDVSPDSTEEGFTTYLSVCIAKKCGLAEKVDTSFHVLNHDHDTKKNTVTVTVQLNSPDVAEAICKHLQFMEFLFVKWTVFKVEEDSETSSFIAASHVCENSLTASASSFVSTSTCDDASLDDDERCLAFLQECVNVKGACKSFKGTKEAFQLIIKSLDKRGIQTNLAECQRRKKRLDEQHRRSPHELWGKYLAYLRGEPGAARPDDVSAQEWLQRHHTTATLTKGGTIPDDVMDDLIEIWTEFRDDYRKAHKNAVFYKIIEREMAKKGHKLVASQWHTKMDVTLSEFKLYTKNLTGRGRPRPWKYYDALKPILEDMVSVTPQQTFDVGAGLVTASNPHIPSTSQGPREGRARPTGGSQASDKTAALQMVIDSRREMMAQFKEIAEGLKNKRKD